MSREVSSDKDVPAVFGENTASGFGVFGKSDQGEGIHAETKSTVAAAMAAFQMNPNSDTAALFAKHTGNRTAAFFEGSVIATSGKATNNQDYPSIVGENTASGFGVFGKSDQGEGIHAETKSTVAAAMAAFQMNPNSDTAALFAKHTGNRTAAFFEGSVIVTGSLTVQSVNLLQRIQQLEQQVQMLSSQVTDIMRNLPTGGTVTPFKIDVTVTQSEVKVTGQGFRPTVKCFIIVVYPDFSRKVFEDTANSNGELNFNTSVSTLCIPGLTLALSFTINQPDTSGRDKFTNTVVKSISC